MNYSANLLRLHGDAASPEALSLGRLLDAVPPELLPDLVALAWAAQPEGQLPRGVLGVLLLANKRLKLAGEE